MPPANPMMANRPQVSASCACPKKNMPMARGGRERIVNQKTVVVVASVRDRKSTTSELQSLMRISYAVFCLTKKKQLSKLMMCDTYDHLSDAHNILHDQTI